jgi:hypothetical protein
MRAWSTSAPMCLPAVVARIVSTYSGIKAPKRAGNMNDPCGAQCPDLPRVL